MPHPVIVISRALDDDTEKRAFEDALIDELERTGDARVLVMPEVSHLDDDHPGRRALLSATENVIIYASWLYPRAAYWLLRWLGVEGESPSSSDDGDRSSEVTTRTIHTYDLGAFDSPEAFIMEIPRATGGDVSTVTRFDNNAGRRWYPVLDDATCVGCRQCYDFCLFGVYTLNDAKRPVPTSPDNCKPGCVACARICPVGAIMFPHHQADVGIAGAPGKKPQVVRKDIAEVFAKRTDPCPLCGCLLDCERSLDGTAPPGKTVCPACGCLCDPSTIPSRKETAPGSSDDSRDDLDDLIDALDEMDV